MSVSAAEELEKHYDPKEVEILLQIRKATLAVADENERDTVLVRRRNFLGRQLIRKLWPDELERISKTHFIQTKERGLQLLKPNYAQKKFHDDVIVRCRSEARPIRGRILKARQLGFSTFIQCWQYEQCDTNAHRGAMTVSYDDPSTEELHRKVKTVHDMLWFPLPLKRDRGTLMEFEAPHSSIFHVKTAGTDTVGRSFTVHHLHLSEIPMWQDPEPVITSAHQAVPTRPFTSIFWESTARGALGVFYEGWQASEGGESDFIPFFAPWFWDPEYQLPFPSADHKRRFMRTQGPDEEAYMRRYNLSPEQMAWRVFKIRTDCSGSVALFQQEYPACAEEAFLTTGSPVFNARAIQALKDNVVAPAWVGDIFLTASGALGAPE